MCATGAGRGCSVLAWCCLLTASLYDYAPPLQVTRVAEGYFGRKVPFPASPLQKMTRTGATLCRETVKPSILVHQRHSYRCLLCGYIACMLMWRQQLTLALPYIVSICPNHLLSLDDETCTSTFCYPAVGWGNPSVTSTW